MILLSVRFCSFISVSKQSVDLVSPTQKNYTPYNPLQQCFCSAFATKKNNTHAHRQERDGNGIDFEQDRDGSGSNSTGSGRNWIFILPLAWDWDSTG